MTREEAKEMLPFIQAYAEGKAIEQSLDGRRWFETCYPSWNPNLIYRIKPERNYRPFKSQEECWNEMLKHQPFGWIRLDDMYINIVCVQSVDKQIELSPENLKFEEDAPADIKRMFISFERAFNEYLFADGTPFGIMED